MADAWGIEDTYVDALGERQSVAPEIVQHLREIIGRPAARTAPIVIGTGEQADLPRGRLELEDGSTRSTDGPVSDLPVGYHRLDDGGDEPRCVIASPRRCHLPKHRSWGWAAQLYAARSRSSWGMGDLGDLARLASFARDGGAEFVLVNPLDAVAPCLPQQASPYFPATRRFHNPIYLAVDDVAPRHPAVTEEFAVSGRALNADATIDRDTVWRLKSDALNALWHMEPAPAEFERWFERVPRVLRDFATWCSLVEHHGGDFRRWPSEYRHPHSTATVAFARANDERLRFHAWLQWLFELQLGRVESAIALIRDLPIGFDAAGFDAWTWQQSLAPNVTIGAPPDEFNRQGQNWGLPAFVPSRLRERAYQPFIETIRSTLGSSGGGLRIDHVMGLSRLWWIPEGNDPSQGAYVRYPCEDLLAILAIESRRARAVVVGEDLGTVEEDFRRLLAAHDILSYRLLWFEQDDPSRWPAQCLAAVTTHDLPTVAGLWSDADLDDQRQAGLHPDEHAAHVIRDRLETAGQLAPTASNAEAVLAAHQLLGRSPARMIAATLDDALAVARRPNIPGADEHRPNWQLALPLPIEELTEHSLAQQISATLGEITRRDVESSSEAG